MSLAMLWGNFYYVYMGRKLALKEQRGDVCVMPYGISTMGAFAFIYAIVLPTYTQCRLTHNKTHCQELAYYVALASNFLVGIILLLFCIVGEFIRRNTPAVALLSSLSGLGFAYLALNECLPVVAKPIVSFVPFIIVMLGYFGGGMKQLLFIIHKSYFLEINVQNLSLHLI
jgi:AGZA family xanthine/uracil permease-like MFS transporter